jgi:hypothetical protein
MVSQDSKDLIRKYIIDCEGKATKSEVAKFMQNEAPENLRLSRDTVMKVIDTMENIIISKGERRGQGHRLRIEDKREFNQINNQLLKIENFMNETYEKFLNQFNRDLSERPAGTVLGLEEVVKFISFIEYSFHGIVLFVLQDIFNKIVSEKDKQVLYNRVIQLMLKLSHLSRKGRVEFFSKQIKQVEKFIESHDFELIYYHYGISNNSLKKLISIMENLK